MSRFLLSAFILSQLHFNIKPQPSSKVDSTHPHDDHIISKFECVFGDTRKRHKKWYVSYPANSVMCIRSRTLLMHSKGRCMATAQHCNIVHAEWLNDLNSHTALCGDVSLQCWSVVQDRTLHLSSQHFGSIFAHLVHPHHLRQHPQPQPRTRQLMEVRSSAAHAGLPAASLPSPRPSEQGKMADHLRLS